MKCAKCGAELEDGVLFCRECGAKVEIPRKKFCRECGAPLADGVKFCSECGAKIDLIVDSPVSASITNTIESSDQGKTDNDNPAEAEKKKTAPNVDSIKERAAKFAKEVDLPNADKIKEKATKFAKQVDLPKAKGNVKKYLIIAVVAIILIAAIGSRIGKSSTSRSSTNSNNTPRSAETTTVPESKIPVVAVTDMSYPEAVEALKAAGFSNVTSNIEPNTDESQWVVVKQSVDPGKKIRPGDKIELTCAMRCKLYIDVHSEANLMFSTYDITVSLDGTELGSIPNGKNFTLLADILSGDHTLVFCKAGSSSPKATKTISVTNDVTYSCDLAHSGSSIDIKNENIQDNINGAALEVIDVTGMVLSEAMTKLNEIGFSNLREEPYSDIWDKDNWIVTAQGIAAGTTADKNDFIQLDCIKLDEYFSRTYVGKSLSEVQELAAASGFSLKYNDESGKDLDSKVASLNQESKTDWIVTKARQYGGADKTAMVTLQYVGEVVESTPVPTPTPAPTTAPSTEPAETPASTPNPTTTPKPTPTPKKSYSDSEVKSMLSTLFSTQFSSKEYRVTIENSMVNIYFFPQGFTAAVYNASVIGDRSAISEWNSLVSTAKTWSKDITQEVHDTMGRDDLSVVLYYCDDTGSENAFLVVMDGVVYYDLVNGIDLLGIG